MVGPRWYLDEKQNAGAVFFALSKTFDSVPHLGILRALTWISVTGSLHTWLLTSYLVACSVLSLMVTLHRSQNSHLVSPTRFNTRTSIILDLYWPAVLHPAVCHVQNPTLCRWHLTSQSHQEGQHFRCRQPSKRHQLCCSMGKTLRFMFKHLKD